MFGTFFTSTATGATMLITFLGFPSAIGQWVPFTLLAEAIHTIPDPIPGEPDIDDDQSILLADTSTHQPLPQNEELFAVEGESADGDDDENEAERFGDRDILMGNMNARRSWADVSELGEDHLRNGGATPSRKNLSAKAGVILGIQNIFIVVPQFLVTGMTSFIFAILEPHKSVLHGDHPGKTPPNLNTTSTTTTTNDNLVSSRQELGLNGPPSGPNSVAIIFRIGGIWTIIAFVMTWRLAKELRRHY